MSEKTRCNYCTLKWLERVAAKTNREVVQEEGDDETKRVVGVKGTNVYLVPAGRELNRDVHFAAWLMELTDHCVC